jgi:hypothetical protein
MGRTPESIRSLVERQIAGKWNPSFGHALTLKHCLVPPVRISMEVCAGGADRVADLWLVLEEFPEANERGCRVVYDESLDLFGLAIDGKGTRLCVLGFHGDFMETLAAM